MTPVGVRGCAAGRATSSVGAGAGRLGVLPVAVSGQRGGFRGSGLSGNVYGSSAHVSQTALLATHRGAAVVYVGSARLEASSAERRSAAVRAIPDTAAAPAANPPSIACLSIIATASFVAFGLSVTRCPPRLGWQPAAPARDPDRGRCRRPFLEVRWAAGATERAVLAPHFPCVHGLQDRAPSERAGRGSEIASSTKPRSRAD